MRWGSLGRIWSQWNRKRRLAAAARQLRGYGWTVEQDLSSREELIATYWDGEINWDLTFRPPAKPAIGYVGNRRPDKGEGPPLPEFLG